MAPTVENNQPPQTWITAAPQDTITSRDEFGNLVPAQPGNIPFRFHLYWSGSDEDGAVSGFYWAVTETIGVQGLPEPPLPGPKAQDYRFTARTDSVFIFNVLEGSNNRRHAFYIYSVDNKGKADPTPARVIFNTLDRYPPIPVIDPESRATGNILHHYEAWDGIGSIPVPTETTIALRDTFCRCSQVSDIVPMNSVIRMRWHSELTIANNPAVAYKYKIGEGEEVDFVQVPASVTGTEYNTTDRNRLGPGLKVFTLRAIDQAGGARTSPETTRRFYMNMMPDTWFAGPDTNQAIYSRLGRDRYVQAGIGGIVNWTTPIPGSYLHRDSVDVMPAKRVANKTFFEIYSETNFANQNLTRHRIYARSEYDTVHMNSWVLFHGGGFDSDSPYSTRVLPEYQGNFPADARGSRVLTSTAPNGSAIGFRFRVPVRLDSVGPVDQSTQSDVYPLANQSKSLPLIGGYTGMQQSGRAYVVLRAEDGNGRTDDRIDDPVGFKDSLEKNLIGPGHPRWPLRDKVITFYVNRAPYLTQTEIPPNVGGFQPQEGQAFATRSITLTLDKVADDDPYQRRQRDVGGFDRSLSEKIIRYSVLLRGKRTGSVPPKDTVYAPPHLRRRIDQAFTQTLEVPSFIEGPNVGVEIEVCDCTDCELFAGQGRCRRYPRINVTVPVFTQPPAPPSSADVPSTRPGSSAESKGRTP